jgi:phthalate 4,5-cis-dihydrodiol dehydrogenase
LHADHVAIAVGAGKHALVEKPMAVTLEEAEFILKAVARAGVVLVVGHSHSFDAPIRRIREIIETGELGRVRMIHNLSFTDWLYRPRRPDELDLAQGGGATYRQGAHQVDIIRYIGGGMLRSVRAQTFAWDDRRPTSGAHNAYLQFIDGTAATAIYNGYGAFLGTELGEGVGPTGVLMPTNGSGKARREFRARASIDESAAKRARTDTLLDRRADFQPFFGLTIVSCEGGDIRQSRDGLFIYDENGRREEIVVKAADSRHPVLKEFCDAISLGIKPVHDGAWGMANLEACIAIIQSSQSNVEVILSRQVAV